MSDRLFVGNLNYEVTERDLRVFFGDEVVTDVVVIRDRETGRSRGFGFVSFRSHEDAINAVAKFDGMDLRGRSVRINEAHDRDRGRPPRARHASAFNDPVDESPPKEYRRPQRRKKRGRSSIRDHDAW